MHLNHFVGWVWFSTWMGAREEIGSVLGVLFDANFLR